MTEATTLTIAFTTVLNTEEAEEEGGSLLNTAGKLVSAHCAHGIHPIYGVNLIL